jgi:hypothetical protein
MVREAWIAVVAAALAAGGATARAQPPATLPAQPSQRAPDTQPAADSADAPTYITIHVKDAKGSDVLKEISRQAKVHVQGWPDFFWNGQQPGLIPPVTLDLDHVTFWSAIESLCKITHSHPQFIGQPNDISLAMGNPGNWDQEGQFAFVPVQIARSSKVDLTNGVGSKTEMLTMAVYVDPKIHAMRWDVPHLTVAEDEHGKSLLPVGPINPNSFPLGIQQPWTTNISVPLSLPPNYGATLARLEGTVAMHPQDQAEVMEINDLAKAVGTQATVANHKVDIVAFSFDGKNTVSMHLLISRPAAEAKKSPPHLLQDFQSARVVDASGQEMTPAGRAVRSDMQVDWTGAFTASKPAKAPFTLRWPIPTGADVVVIPFKFKDLPLPPH